MTFNELNDSFRVSQIDGCMNGFLIWLKDVVNRTNLTKEAPVLLNLDGLCSHKNLKVIEFAISHHVHMLS